MDIFKERGRRMSFRFRLSLLLCLTSIALASGCAPKSGTFELGSATRVKQARHLDIEAMGFTREFKLGTTYTGTVNQSGSTVGLGYHVGTKNTEMTLSGVKDWTIDCQSRAQAFGLSEIAMEIHNPYACEVMEKGKKVGLIALNQPAFDIKQHLANSVWTTNLELNGEINVKGKRLKLTPLFKKADGTTSSFPLGYRVGKGKTDYGIIQVDRTPMSYEFIIWLRPGLSKTTEQTVVASLLAAANAL